MLAEVGVRLEVNQTLCQGKTQCEAVNPEIKPGVLYEAEVVVDSAITSRDEAIVRMYELVKAVRKQYPGVIITYIGIADTGDRFTVQMIDDPGWQLIAVIVLIAIVVFGIYGVRDIFQSIRDITIRFIEFASEFMEKISGEGSPVLKTLIIATAVTMVIASLGYLVGKVASLRGEKHG